MKDGAIDCTWIQVEVSDGMFSTEYAITMTLLNGGIASFFLDKYLVKEEDGKYYIKVWIAEICERLSRMRVRLPREALETGSCWVELQLRSHDPNLSTGAFDVHFHSKA